MTKSKLHGLSSIVLFYAAMILALVEVSRQTMPAGVIFLALILAATFGIVYSYCAKCCCKHRCSHVVLGKLTRFVPDRKIERYTWQDYTALILSFLVVLVYPQFWIWENIWLACGFLAACAVCCLRNTMQSLSGL